MLGLLAVKLILIAFGWVLLTGWLLDAAYAIPTSGEPMLSWRRIVHSILAVSGLILFATKTWPAIQRLGE